VDWDLELAGDASDEAGLARQAGAVCGEALDLLRRRLERRLAA
jgi:hypothetical protein